MIKNGNGNGTKDIMLGREEGGKNYAYNEAHDPTKPIKFWFQQSPLGLVLFAVFYTQACRWSRCLGCNLPSTSSQHYVGYKDLVKQIDFLFALPEIQEKREEIRHIIVSNNGSVLDYRTFSSMALTYLVLKTNLLIPNLSLLTFETRPEYVEPEVLTILQRGVKEADSPVKIELAVGFEAYDDRIRNHVYKKGLTKRTFEELMDNLARFEFGLRCYMMQKPVPGITDEEAVLDIQNAFEYFAKVSSERLDNKGMPRVPINIHLNPTYVSHGTMLEKYFQQGEYLPPNLHDVARAVLHAEKFPEKIFIGLNDEGLAVDGGSFLRNGDCAIVSKMEEFNRTQNYDILREIVC